MNEVEMRRAVAEAYGGYSWKEKVNKMPEKQVIAIYLSLKKKGKVR